MFEDLLNTISGLDGSKVEVPISAEPDEQGYIDRECPAEECTFTFKVHGEDWRDIVRDEAVWCPFCGEERDANAWWTTEQIESGQQAALAKVGDLLNGFNRRQPKRSFLSMTMRVDARPKTVTLPATASAPMELKVTCETCQCRFAVIGSAYFCPACGHNSADRVFQQSLRTIVATLDNLDAIEAGLPDRDAAHNTGRLLVEDSLQRIVTAFQRYAEALFARHASPPKARRNVFQSLTEGSTLWQQAYGVAYSAHLDTRGLDTLKRYFQQRHLLAHCDGIVDADYLAKTNDPVYRAGQRIVVREAAVRDCLTLVGELAAGLARDAASQATP
jgi:hypothetical protein